MGSGRDANLPKRALLRTLYRWPPWGASNSSKSKHWHDWLVRNGSSIALKYLIGLTCRYCNVRMVTTVDNSHRLKLLSYITVLRRNTNHTKKGHYKNKRNHAERLNQFTAFWRESVSDVETNAKYNSAYVVNKYGKRYKHRTLAKSQTRQTNMTI